MLCAMAESDELLKNAGRFFTKLGGQIKQTAKQVTGVGRGTLRLELDQTKASAGGTIAGRVNLAFAEPVDAKRLVITLQARQKMVSVRRSEGTVGTSHADVYKFDLELGSAKKYESGALPFELTVPPDAMDMKASAPSTPLGDVVRTVASAVSPTAGPIEWRVIATLEIPWGRNFTHEVDIVVTR